MSRELPSLGAVRRYLKNQNWAERAAAISGLEIFTKDDADFGVMQLVLPTEPGIPDTDRRIEQAIRTVADMQERSFDTVADEIHGIGYDLIEAALPSPRIYRDSVSYRVAESFVRTSRALLRSAAVAEYDFLLADKPRQLGYAYADACRFGHTFRGSFGFRIMSIVGPHDRTLLAEDDSPPPERLIVQRLARGLRAAETASLHRDPDALLVAARDGLSAGGCFALAQLLERSESTEVAFTIAFSPEWRTPVEMSDRSSTILRTEASQVIRQAGQLLKARMPAGPATVEGTVIRLSSKVSPADLQRPEGREIGIEWQSEDYGDVTVRVRLTPADYLKALDAHRDGYEVSVRGILEPGTGNSWRMSVAENFTVVEQSPVAV